MTEPVSPQRAMSPERWRQVQDVLVVAIESDPIERSRLLDQHCAGDPELRREVETLLAAHDADGLVDRLASDVATAASWARAHAAGYEGCRVKQYVIANLIGAGGMGLVYKARDERLGRHVALKFLPPHLSTEIPAKQRFLTEARAAAALDHPAVCTIHEVGETDEGQLFIAMALYDGTTLDARLGHGRLSFREATPIVLHIARGLGHAHDCGIVHRDVKPSNVMVLPDGTVKILDFGIAKTQDHSLTGQGIPIGTVAYMSPEHLRGDTVDRRSDIWSLGVLLHEMLTGSRPFSGNDRESIARGILFDEPDLSATSYPDVPAGVDALLRRALDKSPERRYPSMAALAAHLTALASAADGDVVGTGVGLPSETDAGHQTPPAGERRRAAVLVTTISDYASLIEQVAPAQAERLVAQVRDIAVEVMRQHGGLVNQAIGEEMVSVFGVPTAHEDDELRAVRAALALHARVRELSSAAGTPAVRIQSGLHAGPVVTQRLNEGPRRYAIVGAAGQMATRLAAIARPDGVVLSPECHRVVAFFVRTAPCAGVILDNEGQPVRPFCVTGETGLETRLEASEQSGLTPFVGRQFELALLESHVGRARAGDGRVVIVMGEAGAGKSRLLHELRGRVDEAVDVRVLHGRCRTDGSATPYSPFIEIIRDALNARAPAITDSGDLVARLRAIDASLEPFLPLYLHLLSVPSESHPLPRHLQGEHLQAALLDALAALMAAMASHATTVVLLEDWHWTDAASGAALGRLTEIVAAQRLVLVVTTRPERGGLGEWAMHGTRIQLDPLDLAASTAIMQAVLRAERVSNDLAQRVFERTGGNPFFLEQVCCALLEQGAVAPTRGEALVHGGAEALSLPDSVQAVIRTRLDNLEPQSREVLRVAAVIGREFEHAVLAEALDPNLELSPALGRLKDSGLIQQISVLPEVAYRFRHVLTQEVSYDSLLKHQRTSLHDAIGRVIEQRHRPRLDEHAALLAHHFSRAEAWPKAVEYGRRAANRASALSQFTDALAMLDQVLEWLKHLADDEARDALKADLLLEQERECETLGLRARQRAIIADLIAHLTPRGPSARLAEAYLREGDLLTLLKRFSAADRALTTALRVSREWGDTALERSTLRSIGLLRWHEGRHEEALALTEHALAIDRECRDELAVAGDLTNLGNILKGMGEYAAAQPRLEEALALPSLARDPKKLSYALHSLANIHRGLGETASALACLRQADEISRVNLLPIQRSFHLTSIAHLDLQQGRIDSALGTYEEAVALSRRARHANGLAQSLRALGEMLFGLGRYDEAAPRLREAATLFAQLEDRESEAEMWSRVAAACEGSSAAESLEAWRTARALRQQLGDARGEVDALEGVARATRQVARAPEEAIEAFDAALALASTLGDTHRQLRIRNVLGILEWDRGGYPQALRHYEAALLLVRAHGDRVHEGLVLNSLGVTLSRLNRPEEARTALEESVALNRDTEQRLLEAHALAALGHLSLTERRPDRAVQYFEQSLHLRRAIGDTTGADRLLRRIAEARSAASGAEATARDAN